MSPYVLKYIDEGRYYPKKDLLLSTYNRFDTLDNHLMRKRGGPTLDTCDAFKTEVVRMGLQLNGNPRGLTGLEPNRNLPRHTRFLLNKPCMDIGIDYNQLFEDFFALEAAVSEL
jgi:hypothetical protein